MDQEICPDDKEKLESHCYTLLKKDISHCGPSTTSFVSSYKDAIIHSNKLHENNCNFYLNLSHVYSNDPGILKAKGYFIFYGYIECQLRIFVAHTSTVSSVFCCST